MMRLRKSKTKAPWWQSPEIAPLISRAIKAYREFKVLVQHGDISKIDLQFEALHHLIVAYNKYRFNNTADQFLCICGILDEGLTTERKQTVIDMLQKIGMEKVRSAFIVLNQVCDESFREPTNLFSINKKVSNPRVNPGTIFARQALGNYTASSRPPKRNAKAD